MTRVVRPMTRMLVRVIHCVATVTLLCMKMVPRIGELARYSKFSVFSVANRHTIAKVTESAARTAVCDIAHPHVQFWHRSFPRWRVEWEAIETLPPR